MFSKALELSGFALVAIGVGMLLGTAAGIIAGGCALVFVGSVTNDAAITAGLKRGAGWFRFAWHRQRLREEMAQRESSSPHPPIHIDPVAQERAERMARAREARGALAHDRTKALSRADYEAIEEDLERIY